MLLFFVENLQEFQELKFKYVEEDSPDDFFIPYVWSLVYRYSGLGFEQKSLNTFGPYDYGSGSSSADLLTHDLGELGLDVAVAPAVSTPSLGTTQ